MKMVKYLKIILVVLILNSFIILLLNVKADSGFDSSWDSGGSWDSGSSWDSGGSWDSGSSWDSSSSHDRDYKGASNVNISIDNHPILYFMLYLIWIFLVYNIIYHFLIDNFARKKAKKIFITLLIIRSIILPIYLFKSGKYEFLCFNFLAWLIFLFESLLHLMLKKEKLNHIDYKILDNYAILDNDAILDQIPDLNIDNFYKETFNIYKEVQLAWMDNDIERVRSILSDEMFNTYKMQLETLRVKNQKNIMEDITLKNVYITNIIKENNKEIIEVIMNVTCKDYLIDITTQKVLRGNKDKVWNYEYKLSYMRTTVFKNTDTCPNCGASLNYGQSVKCEHCGTIINRETDKFVLIDKKMLTQLEK